MSVEGGDTHPLKRWKSSAFEQFYVRKAAAADKDILAPEDVAKTIEDEGDRDEGRGAQLVEKQAG